METDQQRRSSSDSHHDYQHDKRVHHNETQPSSSTAVTDASQNSSQWRNVNPLQFCFIKATLTSIEETLRYPLALIKTHQQVTTETRSSRRTPAQWTSPDPSDVRRPPASINGSSRPTQPPSSSTSNSHRSIYRPSAHHTFKYTHFIYRTFGLKGLYRGFPCYIVPAVPVNVLYFYSYNEAKEILYNQLSSNSNHDSLSPDPQRSPTRKSNFTTRLLIPASAGVIADALCLTCWVPFDIISQHLQLQDVRKFPPSPIPSQPPSSYNPRSPLPLSTSNSSPLKAMDVIRQIWKTNGIRGFYRGYFLSLFIHTPSSGIWWVSYESTKTFLTNSKLIHAQHFTRPVFQSESQPIPFNQPTTNTLNSIPTHISPTNITSNHLITNSNQFTPFPTTHSISSTSPPYSSTPSPSLYPSTLSIPDNIPIIMLSGCVAGASASFVSNPLDVVKTRLQTTLPHSPLHTTPSHDLFDRQSWQPKSVQHSTSAVKTSSQRRYSFSQSSRGFFHHFFILLRNEGLSGFFRGYIPRVCVSMPTSAVSLVVYELALKSATIQ